MDCIYKALSPQTDHSNRLTLHVSIQPFARIHTLVAMTTCLPVTILMHTGNTGRGLNH